MAIPTSKYRGAALPGGQTLQVGDYLMSPNGRFCGQLQHDGSFGVYWNRLDVGLNPPPPEFDPGDGIPLWSSPGAGEDEYFLAMQTDGNLCIYRGTVSKNRGLVWQSDRPRPDGGTFALNMQNDGCLRVTRNGEPGWATLTEVIEIGITTIISDVGDQTTYMALSSKRPTAGTDPVLQAAPYAEGLSVTGFAWAQGQPTADQLWLRLDWLENKQLVASVMINQQTGLALSCDPDKCTTRMSPAITQWSMWTFGSDEHARFRAVRPYGSERLNLNVKGDAPYYSGTPVILWNWVRSQPNLIWEFYGRFPAPIPQPSIALT